MATNLVKLSGLLRPALGGLAKVCVYRDATIAAPLTRLFSRLGREVPNPARVRPFWTQVSPSDLNFAPCHSIFQRIQPLLPSLALHPVRSLTYYSVKRGKRKTVKAVVKRFLRLHCGLWLRRKSGYKKKLWKKLPARRTRLRQHVFCNRTQTKLLDKMTTSFWKRRNWYLNDPYQKYHDRTNLKV
ncbi:39S ribosomal protein L35, mitochondrial [Anguilla anguilla]|nr:39S ribosomal protein L35, mitochondrial [Anguilla anguilla]